MKRIKKTKVLKISKGQKGTVVKIRIKETEIEQVREFCCLESFITTDAKSHREIKGRIAIEILTIFSFNMQSDTPQNVYK